MGRRITVVYLAGFGRSGSTLVERALGACPGWDNVGELVDLARGAAPRDERCGCGVGFSACPVWSEVGRVAFGGWDEKVLAHLAGLQRLGSRQRDLPAMLARSAVRRGAGRAQRDVGEAFGRILRAFAEVRGARVLVDASKGPAFGLALAADRGLDVRVLHVVRDPRAVAWSWMQRVERPHAAGDEMWRVPVGRSAAQWTALQAEVEGIRRLGRLPTARLRYEDLVGDPETALLGAVRALGLPLQAGDLAHVHDGRIELGASHGLSGNPSRFGTGSVALRRDDRWDASMPRADRDLATALTLPLLAAYGYPLAARPAPHHSRRSS